jgi:hypothetical protein
VSIVEHPYQKKYLSQSDAVKQQQKMPYVVSPQNQQAYNEFQKSDLRFADLDHS